MGERRDAYRVLVGKPEGKKPPGRPRRRLEDNIKMDLQDVGWGHRLDCSGSGQGQVAAFMNTAMNFRVPYTEGNFLTS
jgi:hypothetical protein